MTALGERMSVSDALQSLLLEMGQQRTLDGVLRVVVVCLAEVEHIALARIWLLRPGDICSTCPMRKECPDQTRCLHLVASAGRSRMEHTDPWTRTDGDFRKRWPWSASGLASCPSFSELPPESPWPWAPLAMFRLHSNVALLFSFARWSRTVSAAVQT